MEENQTAARHCLIAGTPSLPICKKYFFPRLIAQSSPSKLAHKLAQSIATGLANSSIAIVHENKLYAGCKTANHCCNQTTMASRLVIPHSDGRWLKADDLRLPKKLTDSLPKRSQCMLFCLVSHVER